MAEVMNRAARRAANHGKAGNRTGGMITVKNRIDVVPMAHVETFYNHEIASEGKWRSNVPVVIVQPRIDQGTADSSWFPRTLERMRETRRRKGTIPFLMGLPDGTDMEIDVGLVDIVVFFEAEGSTAPVVPRTMAESDKLLQENLSHVDMLCQGVSHDQMIMAVAAHMYHSSGSLIYHFHNLIFGLRMEVSGDTDILGPLDLKPLLTQLAESGPIGVIGGVRSGSAAPSERTEGRA